MLAQLLAVFGFTEPISTVVEFLIVLFAIGYGVEALKKFKK